MTASPTIGSEAECARCGDVFRFLNAGSFVVFDSWLARHGENCRGGS